MSQDRLPQTSGLAQSGLAAVRGLLGRGASAMRRLSERMAFPGDSLALLALLLLANLLRIHFPGGVADAVFAGAVLLMGLSLLRGRVAAGAWPVLLCFVALLVLYGVGLLFAFSLQGVRHWAAILLAGLVFLFCHQNGPALLRSRGAVTVLALALALLLPVYVTNTGINAHTLAAIIGYLLLAVGLVLVARAEDGRRQHWWAHAFFLLFVANGVVFGHRALVGGLLLAYPVYWAGRRLLRGWRGAGLLAVLVAATAGLIVAVLIRPLPVGAASYVDSVFQDYTGGKAETGRQTLWSAALAGMADAPWLGKGPGAAVTALPRPGGLDNGRPAESAALPTGAGAPVQGQESEAVLVTASSGSHACLIEANPRLAADCNLLIGLRTGQWADLEGLWSWDYSYPLDSWRGVTLGGEPPRVTELDLSWLTSLSGGVPPEIAQLDQLVELHLPYNSLTGHIPPELGRLANLYALSLAGNDLSGPIPPQLGLLKDLRYLYLDGNRLSGAIPAELGELPNLQKVVLAGNEFEAPIPEALRRVQEHDLDRGMLCLPGVVGAQLQRDCSVLLLARRTLDPNGKLNWATATPIPSWQGVVLGGSPLRVVQLQLSKMGLGGSLPEQLGALDALEQLVLDRNGLTGPISPQLGRMANLRDLILDYNALSGPVPPQLGSLRQLKSLRLSNNRLTGAIPAALGTMPNLERLQLGGNEFVGTLPPEVRNIRPHGLDDELLCLPGSPTEGFGAGLLRDCTTLLSVRKSLAGAAVLNWRRSTPLIHWQGVVLSGEPLRVVALALEGANLSGRIPAALGGLERLVVLNLANNRLDGSVPAELARLRELAVLSLENNRLLGSLPPELLAVPKLEALYYRRHGFDGPPPLPPPPDGGLAPDLFCLPSSAVGAGLLADCALLLEARDALAGEAELNWRRGAPIGAWRGVVLGGAPPRVVGLDLEDAGLSGRIPARLAGLGRLESLRLADNAFRGPVPAELGGVGNLGELRFGPRPHIWKHDALRQALFCLPLPRVGPGLLKDCEALLAARAALDPDGRLNWRRTTPLAPWDGVKIEGAPLRVLEVDLRRRGLRGQLPAELAALDRLRTLNLNHNELKGSIPPELGSLKSLHKLALGNNALTGSIPPELGGLRRLRNLVLADNALTGSIPQALGELSLLRWLRLSGNAFAGAAPVALREVAWHDLDEDQYCRPAAGVGDALLGDCSLLLNLQMALSGGTGLNWRKSVPIHAWEGVELGGSPLRVRELNLNGKGLLGRLPPELGELAGLEVLSLEGNALRGRIPPQLGKLANLRELRLRGNRLSGRVPVPLGALGRLSLLRLGGNDIAGPIPESLLEVANSDLNRPTCPLVPAGNYGLQDDCANLLAVRDELAGSATLNWSEAAPMSAWHGVALGGEPQRVRVLDLAWKKPLLEGRIPAALGRLEGLQTLYLGGHSLQGSIPAQLGDLRNLKHLYVEANSLTGPVPTELGALKNLEHLYLEHNSLTGPIPAELGRLEKITHLSLCHNSLTGSIPAELAALENLEQLSLCGNSLTGAIPIALGDLGNLQSLRLERNQLSGVVPPALGTLPELRLDGNSFDGVTPSMPHVEENWDPAAEKLGLVLARAMVDGEDGMELCDPTANRPPASGLLQDCSILLEAQDSLTGGVALNWSPSTPVALWRGVALRGTPPRVIALDLVRLGLRGVIPAQLGGLDALASLRLSHNALTGPIPAALGGLANLQELLLNGNALTGAIPAELGNLRKLKRLQLWGNRLTGDAPAALAARLSPAIAHQPGKEAELTPKEQTSKPLRQSSDGPLCTEIGDQGAGLRQDCATLLAVKGELAGGADLNWSEALPVNAWQGVWIGGEPVRIMVLNLPAAGLSGRIPARLAQLDQLASLQLSGNRLTGSIPAALGGLGKLKALRLSDNRLTGAIPRELGELAELRKLALDGNQLTGGIPTALTKLAELDELHLANNQLGGSVPPALALLDNLVSLRLGGNDFSGCLPAALKGVGDARMEADLACGPSPWGKPPLLEDAAVLMAARDLLAGDGKLNWSYSEPITSWRGVVVAGAPPRVVAVNLSGAGLSGRIPAELAALDQLGWLRLSDNRLTGAIPPELGRLTNLRELALQGNALTGAVPSQLQHLFNLEELRLGGNQLSGAIPDLGQTDSLWVLTVLGNDFTGCLPDSLLRFGSNLRYSLGLPVCGEEAKGAEAGIGAAIQALNKLVDPTEREGVARSAHNLFLQFGLQTGILGLSLLALLCASLIFSARSRTGGEVRPVQRFVATCIVMVIMHNVFEVYLLQNLLSVGICSWVLIGMGTGEIGRSRPEQPA